MSIASEITRLQGVKAEILQAISDKGVTVPAGSALDDCPDLIASIEFNLIGGREYKTVSMPDGNIWLAENLDFRFCGIGGSGTPSIPNAWYYDNDAITYGINGSKDCGLLYNWYAVEYLETNKATLCPGWHVPTTDEWNALANAVGGASVAATKLKAVDGSVDGIWPTGWNGADDYGFGVLPAGAYYGNFWDVGTVTNFWTITESGSKVEDVYFGTGAGMFQYTHDKESAFSLRLVKD